MSLLKTAFAVTLLLHFFAQCARKANPEDRIWLSVGDLS